MKKGKITALLLDVDYTTNEEGDIAIRLFLKHGNEIEVLYDWEFKPYFYIIVDNPEKRIRELQGKEFQGAKDEKIKLLKVEACKKGNAENVLKLHFKNTEELVKLREQITDFGWVSEKREYDIVFAQRYLIDKNLEPMNFVEAGIKENNGIASIKKVDREDDFIKNLRVGCFDIETYAPSRFSDPEKDAVMMIAYTDREESTVLTTKKVEGVKGVKVFENETEMLKAFVEKVASKKLDAIVTYNGDNFDFPYLLTRCKKLKVDFNIGSLGEKPRLRKRGNDLAAKIAGLQHIDAYQLVRLLGRFGAINLVKYDLESVVEVLFGKKKEKITAEQMTEIWDSGKGLDRMARYNREDAEFTLKIAEQYLPLIVEMCRLVREPMYGVVRASASSLVESLLINKSFEINWLVPNRPKEAEVKARIMQTFKGGYVKQPLPGLHENIAVLDFRSLHPSIIIAHHISPENFNCKCCKGKTEHVAPTGDWFCKERKGFLPSVLEQVLGMRTKIKKEMEKAGRKSLQYKMMDARQHSLKIILNSSYGYLGYARSRWYSRECARAVTAWSRHYIRETIHKAEAAGFTALYSDTDSLFLIVPQGKSEKDILKFVEKINSELPGTMELEFEGMFKRGIFVTKKEGTAAAKKRYALIDFKDNLKIVGFEYVRRDWAVVAKETQRDVIEAVLKEGKPEKAVEIVRKSIAELKAGKVPKERLIIMTQIRRPLSKYESIGPHIAASKKAVARGKQIEVGSVISYIITKSGKSISDKAELEEYVKQGNYDAEYYINNQLLPAVIKIVAELGYSEEDLVHGGKQKKLSAFS